MEQLKISRRLHLISICLFVFAFCNIETGYAQRSCISTNLLEWGILTPNIGIELRLNHKSTIAMDVAGCPWRLSEKLSLRQISVRPEYRYWLKQAFYAHFIGINLLYSAYDLHLKHKFYDGNMIALGLGYGYSFILNERLNLVPAVGFGVGYNHSRNLTTKSGIKPVLTHAAITLQYILR